MPSMTVESAAGRASSRKDALQAASERYELAKRAGLALDISRGKPSAEQLDLCNEMLGAVTPSDCFSETGADCRNYGVVEGLPEARRLFADYIEAPVDQVLVQDNSSLRLMHDTLAMAMLRGVPDGERAWRHEDKVKFLCPVPGYDRHFGVCEHLGVEMIPVAIGETGPDLERVAQLARDDHAVRGMFCVPKYSNPTGAVYSDEVVRGLASMKTSASDFRIVWDNAYAVHHLGDGPAPLANLLELCARQGHPNRAIVFGSTSKISFGGGGLSVVASSPANIEAMVANLSKQTIGPDKLNQLRHVRFFKDLDGILRHMGLHAEILRPKFELVDRILRERLEGMDVASWRLPAGGYFISLDANKGCARRVVQLAAEAGLKLTGAGATYPHGDDPHDSNLRLAPSLPSLEELRPATELIADCLLIAGLESR